MIELWFLFSLIWSVCASVDEDSRKKMDNFLRELEGQFPAKVPRPSLIPVLLTLTRNGSPLIFKMNPSVVFPRMKSVNNVYFRAQGLLVWYFSTDSLFGQFWYS